MCLVLVVKISSVNFLLAVRALVVAIYSSAFMAAEEADVMRVLSDHIEDRCLPLLES